MQGDRTIRVGKNHISLLDEIKKQELEKRNIKISYRTAGEILADKIKNVGGLKSG